MIDGHAANVSISNAASISFLGGIDPRPYDMGYTLVERAKLSFALLQQVRRETLLWTVRPSLETITSTMTATGQRD